MRLCTFLWLCLAAAPFAFVMSSPHIWTTLTLTHHWPMTFCGMEHCHSDINYWTLHGLWPDNGQHCNSSWHFNSSLIEDLLPDMEKSWPDLLNPSSTGFWKYEWGKHGTCAAEAESLDSQHKYFSKALELHHKVDLDSVLKKFDINPSKQYYSFGQIEKAINGFYGVNSKIQCVHPSKNDNFQILGQIEICFASDFSLIDCEKEPTLDTGSEWRNQNISVSAEKTSGFSVCDHDVPVYYPPVLRVD